MSKGVTKPGSTNEALTKMPKGIGGYIQFEKSTGMMNNYVAYEPVQLLSVLQGLTFPPHADNVYDCEDRAFWAIAHVRCKLPGQPIAAALGVAVDDFAGQNHAVVAFWAKAGNAYELFFYDPEANINKPIKATGKKSDGVKRENLKGDLVRFDTKVIVPFPVDLNGDVAPKDLSKKFDKFKVASGALVLDRDYTLINRDKREEITTYLTNRDYNKKDDLPAPAKQEYEDRFNAHWLWSIQDRVLWAFAHARRDFQGFAIGMAFGTKIKESKDYPYAVIVLWDDDKNPILFDIDHFDPNKAKARILNPDEFKAKTLIV